MARVTRKRGTGAASVSLVENIERTPDMPFEEGVHDILDADMRHRLISEAAYYLYVQRGYDDGYDLDDWLQAEAQVDHVLLNPEVNSTRRPAA
jgi:Protein of unknown function (DUF2934)